MPKLAQKWILESKSTSGFGMNISKIPWGINLGKLPNYLHYFRSNIVEGVAESWVEAEMNWVEVDGAGWRLVHSLVIPVKIFINKKDESSINIVTYEAQDTWV